MKKSILAGLFALLLFSCTTSDTYRTVSVANKYSVDIPDDLTESTDLNDDASMQYENPFNEFYVVVIDESKESIADQEVGRTLETYTQFVADGLQNAVVGAQLSAITKQRVNGLDVRKFSVSGTLEGLGIFYQIAVYESPDHYFQLVQWTEQKRKDDFSQRMEKVIGSFKAQSGRIKLKK